VSRRKLASSRRFSAISFQKQGNSIFIRFTSKRLDRASGWSWLKFFLRSIKNLEYSEILDIVRTCCHVVQTACRDFLNSVDFWNPTPCWILIDLESGRCCSEVRTSSSLSARHWGASRRLQRPVRMVAQEPVIFVLDFARTLRGHLEEAYDQLLFLIWSLSEYMKILNWKPTILLKRNHYINCFCFIQNVAN
jgi:hypothetical protein